MPSEIEFDRIGEFDVMRTTEVGVVVVGSEGRDLDVGHVAVCRCDGHGPELVLVAHGREERLGLLRERGRGEIPVRGEPAQHDVANGPADDVRGMAVGPERLEEVAHARGDGGRDVWRGQFRPRNRYVRQRSLRSSTRYGVNSE